MHKCITVIAAATAATSPSVAQIVYELSGIITAAENLTFAVVNGRLLSQNPQPGDLPLAFNGVFTIDTASSFAQLEINGSFSSATRAFTFDVVTPNVITGLDVLDLQGPVSFSDRFDAFDFDITFSSRTGFGEFVFVNPGVVSSSPAQDVVLRATITDVTRIAVPAPGSTAMALLGSVVAFRRKRRAL